MATRVIARQLNLSPVVTIGWARLGVVLLGGLYPILLLWILRDFVAPTYWYMGYFWSPPSSPAYALFSICLAIVPVFLLPLKGSRPGAVILWILYVVAYVPIQVVPAFSSEDGFTHLYEMQLSVLLGFGILIAMSHLPVIRIPDFSLTDAIFVPCIVLFSLFVLVLAIRSYGVPTGLPSLSDVYDVRAEFRNQNRGVGAIVLFLVSWQQKVINPLLIALGFVQQRWFLLGFGVVGQLALFGINGQKSVFFSGLLVLAVVIAMRRHGRSLGILVMVGAIALLVGTAALDFLNNSVTFTSLFVRRLILTPGMLTGYYFDFFSESRTVQLSNSVLGSLFAYPYEVSIPRLIGVTYFGRPDLAANANIWADAYAHFRVAGVVGFSFLLGLVILIFNSLAIGRSLLVTGALAGMAAWTLSDTSFFVALNTHGILFSLIVLALLPHDDRHQAPQRATRKRPLLRGRQIMRAGVE